MTDQAINFEAVMTMEQLAESETRLKKSHGTGRRLALLTMTKSKDELTKAISDMDDETFEAWIDQIEQFQGDLKALQEMADAALARIIVAGEAAVEMSEARS